MPAETILFLDDRLHAWNVAASIYGVSSTAAGFHAEAVRDVDYLNGWKPNDGSADEYVQVDGGAVDWLGTTGGGTIFLVVAYDARGADQNTVTLTQDTADNPAGAFLTLLATLTLNKTGPTCDYVTFSLSSGGRRYYRLNQIVADRGGGTKTATILSWGMYKATGVLNLDTGYSGVWVSPGRSDLEDEVGTVHSPGGFVHSQAAARMRNSFELRIRRARRKLWVDLVDRIHVAGAGSRAVFVQYEGLKNHARDDFQMARIPDMKWTARRPLVDDFEISIPFRTEAHV